MCQHYSHGHVHSHSIVSIVLFLPYTVCVQLNCCGVEGPEDWLKYNSEAVKNNSGVPPGNCICDFEPSADNDDCERFNGTDKGAWSEVSQGCMNG